MGAKPFKDLTRDSSTSAWSFFSPAVSAVRTGIRDSAKKAQNAQERLMREQRQSSERLQQMLLSKPKRQERDENFQARKLRQMTALRLGSQSTQTGAGERQTLG